mmetsp:Transcript_14190/g.53323  ORF Transcript_14190/g.53323 Transcript_14190/m.53323 type:complete len:264 (+) Transcript_14190:1408-2199(+)
MAPVDYVYLVGVHVAEDVKVVVHEVQGKDGVLKSHRLGEVEGLDLRHLGPLQLHLFLHHLDLVLVREAGVEVGVLLAVQCVLHERLVAGGALLALELAQRATNRVRQHVHGGVHVVALLRAPERVAVHNHRDLRSAALRWLVMLDHAQVHVHALHGHHAELGQRRLHRTQRVLLERRRELKVVGGQLHGQRVLLQVFGRRNLRRGRRRRHHRQDTLAAEACWRPNSRVRERHKGLAGGHEAKHERVLHHGAVERNGDPRALAL